YLAICRPLKRHLSKKQTIGFIIAIWAYVLLLLSPWFITYDLHSSREANATHLSCRSTMTPLYNRIYQLGIIFCLLYAGPLLFIVVCYTLVAHKLSRRTGNQDVFLRKSSTAQDKKQMSRLIKMLVTVVLIFALSWLPLHIIAIMLNFLDNPGSLWFMPYVEQGLPVIQWIGISNCCVNPWIYCAFSKSYRTNFFNTLRCRFNAPAAGTQHRTQQQQQQHHLLSTHSPNRKTPAAAAAPAATLMEVSVNAAAAVSEISTARRPGNQSSSWRRRNGPQDSMLRKNCLATGDADDGSATIPLFERHRMEEAESKNDEEADLASDEV
uniref:G_PROTEIN_RECEP_F1_2 domain-containing protein n=1 Tax=Macrostomum lignano TaxID=282301 RepID=A0A1I8IB53_9PLAT